MSMVCPQCQQTFDQRLSCPVCGVRLQFQVANLKPSSPTAVLEDDERWQQTPWGRMAIGLLVAQGLAYGIQQLMTAGFLASGENVNIWSTLWGIVLLHVVQGLGLIVGGALCGAGQRLGAVYGSVIGLANGIIFLIVQRQTGEVLDEMAVYGQPILHLAFGGLGGLLGRLIWRPTPTFEEEPASQEKSKSGFGLSFRILEGPVYLPRVLAGIAIVVVGVMWSRAILDLAVNVSEGKLALRSHLQTQLVGWEITGLAILFGSGLAGSCTFNGMKQGLCVGLGAALVFMGLQLGNPRAVFDRTLMTAASIFILSLAGGWFGSQLLPPVQVGKRRNRIFTD